MDENISRLLNTNGKLNVKGIILGGPGNMKHKFLNNPKCNTIIKNGIVKIVNIDHINQDGTVFNNIIELSKDILGNEKIIKERNILNDFYNHLKSCDNLIIYEKDNTIELFEMGIISKLILYENISEELMNYFIDNCNKYSTEIIIISNSSSEGNEFVKNFNGIGGILHYPYIKYDDEN